MVAQKTAAKKAASGTEKTASRSKKDTESAPVPAKKAAGSKPTAEKKAAPAKKVSPAKKAAAASESTTTKQSQPVSAAAPAKKAATKSVAKKAPAKKVAPKKAAAKTPTAPESAGDSTSEDVVKAPVKSGRAARGQKQDKYVPIKKNVPIKTGVATAKPTSRAPAAPVKQEPPSEPVFNAKDLAEFKVLIDHELAQIQGEYDQAIAALETSQNGSLDTAGDDPADAGNKTFEREQAMSIAQNRMDLITQMERALYRIRIGSYGVCESCGTTIPKARLQAYPAATLCVACKAREERR